jgi:hypothetical protein
MSPNPAFVFCPTPRTFAILNPYLEVCVTFLLRGGSPWRARPGRYGLASPPYPSSPSHKTVPSAVPRARLRNPMGMIRNGAKKRAALLAILRVGQSGAVVRNGVVQAGHPKWRTGTAAPRIFSITRRATRIRCAPRWRVWHSRIASRRDVGSAVRLKMLPMRRATAFHRTVAQVQRPSAAYPSTAGRARRPPESWAPPNIRILPRVRGPSRTIGRARRVAQWMPVRFRFVA